MSTVQGNGRRGGQVNFSTFIQDLNVEVPSQETSPGSEEWDKDIAMFTNTNFFDWEKATGGAAADFPVPPRPAQEPEAKPTVAAVSREPAASASAAGDFDFGLPG